MILNSNGMKPQMINEKMRLVKTSPYMPAITVIMPFDPKMSSKTSIAEQFGRVVEKVESIVEKDYDSDLTEIAVQKLKRLLRTLNFNTYKKSIAVFVSPVYEKVMYLEIPVEEKIVISDHFDLRELLSAKKDQHSYLLMMIHNNWSKLYLGNQNGLLKIQTNFPSEQWNLNNGELLPKYTPVTKSLMMAHFLKTSDKGLKYLASVYQLPVIVIGRKEVVQQFRKTTANKDMIIEYLEGNYESLDDQGLHRFIHTHFADWNTIRQEDIIHRMLRAKNAGKLVTGFDEVWKLTNQRRGSLLILEKNYAYIPSVNTDDNTTADSYNRFSHVKNPIDDMIGKVLEDGGDVEFADAEILGKYQHIALIQQ